MCSSSRKCKKGTLSDLTPILPENDDRPSQLEQALKMHCETRPLPSNWHAFEASVEPLHAACTLTRPVDPPMRALAAHVSQLSRRLTATSLAQRPRPPCKPVQTGGFPSAGI
ncbi:hypothetical protein WJX75_006875 [Coccomyxa subellipsoidea]|uniref:Uncharacterized protein n=1 Tax=Coccomyxa subellipsoidea TaxID=248742 RepID=A0ABR2YGU3_9CHLO